MEYPAWKKALIEAYRIFTGALLAELTLLIFTEEGINFTFIQSIKNSDDIIKLLLLPSLMAGIKGVIKWLRERYAVDSKGNKDYDHILYRLPA